MNNAQQFPTLYFETQQDWEAWLEEHQTEAGIWLKIAKKGTGIASLTIAQALESALCYGWIDGQRASFDGNYFLQKYTPRRPGSTWSKINCRHVEVLTEAGRMHPAGLRQVELAKADGRWEAAYDAQSTMTVPDDFQSELEKNPTAKAFFVTLNSQNRFAILFRIQTAKKPQTRSARIQKFLAMLTRHEKIYP